MYFWQMCYFCLNLVCNKNDSLQYCGYLCTLFSKEVSIKNVWLGPKYTGAYFLILIVSPLKHAFLSKKAWNSLLLWDFWCVFLEFHAFSIFRKNQMIIPCTFLLFQEHFLWKKCSFNISSPSKLWSVAFVLSSFTLHYFKTLTHTHPVINVFCWP